MVSEEVKSTYWVRYLELPTSKLSYLSLKLLSRYFKPVLRSTTSTVRSALGPDSTAGWMISGHVSLYRNTVQILRESMDVVSRNARALANSSFVVDDASCGGTLAAIIGSREKTLLWEGGLPSRSHCEKDLRADFGWLRYRDAPP